MPTTVQTRAPHWVGQGIPRVDAGDKVRGRAQYVDDLPVPNGWFGHVVRAPVPHGRLRGLTPDPAFDWSRVVVVTAKDIPGPNCIVSHDRSMPVIASDEFLYAGEPVALIAAPTLRLAREAAEHLRIDCEELPAVLTLREVADQFKRNDPALVKLCGQTIRKGDAEAALARADKVVEAEYTAGHQEQLYIEPQGLVAEPTADGGVFIYGSMQCPYFIVHELCEALALPPEKIRVKQAAVGGAFGGKEEFPTWLAGYVALLALKAKRPVKIVYDRHQDILYTTKRHPVWSRYRAGLNQDGTIAAIVVDFLLDGGAYLTLSDVVMYRGILHAAMGYRCDHVFVNGLVARTNTVPSGAFRGFGAPQAIWGLESHVDALAAAAGMTPHEFRLKNCLVQGDTTPTGQVLKWSVGSPAVLEKSLERCRFGEQWKKCSRGKPGAKNWYGIGVSFFAHGAAFTGDGEARIKARAAMDLDWLAPGRPGGIVRVSSTEMGQGALTVLSQLAADGLGLDLSRVLCPFPDTALVPNSGPTVASRTTMVVGSCVYGAAGKLKKALEEFAGRPITSGEEFDEIASAYLNKNGRLRVEHLFVLPPGTQWDQKTFKGDSYPGYSWGCNVAEVEVDPRTLEIRVKKITAFYDIGKVVNPVLAKGQIEGGLVQALGYSVMEKVGIGKKGRFDASRMQTYIIPTMQDVPEMDLHFVEFPFDHAPPGAKGVGELPMDGLAPAIANAIEAATGLRLRDLPITPEKLFEELTAKHAKGAK
ncbi:MAG: xanthine dehydrogenase family protein [Kiritimatiellae bacterium]|nr:xanthine dehydrogenase family protein [Kiritimatiellia bacterium]